MCGDNGDKILVNELKKSPYLFYPRISCFLHIKNGYDKRLHLYIFEVAQ